MSKKDDWSAPGSEHSVNWLRKIGLLLFGAALVLLAAAHNDLLVVDDLLVVIRFASGLAVFGLLLAALSTLWLGVLRKLSAGAAPSWLPYFSALLIASIALFQWSALRHELAKHAQAEVTRRWGGVHRAIDLTLEMHSLSLSRLAHRIGAISDVAEQQIRFEQEASIFLRDYPGLASLAWADSGSSVLAVEPASALPAYTEKERWLELLKAPLNSKQPQFATDRGTGVDPEPEFLLLVPALDDGLPAGYLLVVFNANHFLESALSAVDPSLSLSILHNGTILYQRGESGDQPGVSAVKPGNPKGLLIEVRNDVLASPNLLPEMALALGLALAVLVGLVLHFAMMSRLRTQWAEAMRQDVLAQMAERERVQAQLREASDELRSVMDSISDAVCVLDRQWRFAYLNPRALTLLKKESGELLGKNLWEVFPEVVGTPLETHYRDAMATLQTQDFTIHLEPLDSWFNVRVYPHPNGIAVYFQNNNERHEAEAALRISESRFRTIAHATTDVAWERNLLTNKFWMSDGPGSQFGHESDASESDMQPWIDRIHPDDRNSVLNGIRVAIDKKSELWEDEYRYQRNDGSYAYVTDRGAVIRNESGKTVCMVGGMSDVTERRLHEERLRDSEEYLRAIHDTALEGMICIDSGGLIISANLAAEKIFGFARDELLGRKIGMLMPPADRKWHDDYVAEHGTTVIERYRGKRREIAGRRKDGSVFPMEMSVIEVRRAGSKLLIGFVRDITERRDMERALQQTLSDLDKRNRELRDFAFVASHDLQEPLRKIQMFSDRLLHHYGAQLDDRGREYLQRNAQAGERMQTLIDDLLAYSRIATNGENFVQVDLENLLAVIVDDLVVRLESDGGWVKWGSLPTLWGDPTQLRQVFQNLIANALKFRRPDRASTVCVDAELIQRPSGESAWKITIADNGIGFDVAHAEKIFAPFQRLHGRGDYEGSGMGLAIVRRIVERHGGEIKASAIPGEGANFVLIMPMAAILVDPTAPQKPE